MAAQDLFDQPQAGGAAYVLEDERSFVSARCELPDFILWRQGKRGARLVVALESRAGDGARYGFAAGAAELALGAEHGGAVPAGRGYGLAAVEAGDHRPIVGTGAWRPLMWINSPGDTGP
jgi:hypothetical protein